MAMERLYPTEITKAVRPAFDRVFVNPNPYETKFAPPIEAKIVIFPTEGYLLSEDQFNAISRAASLIGDEYVHLFVGRYLLESLFPCGNLVPVAFDPDAAMRCDGRVDERKEPSAERSTTCSSPRTR